MHFITLDFSRYLGIGICLHPPRTCVATYYIHYCTTDVAATLYASSRTKRLILLPEILKDEKQVTNCCHPKTKINPRAHSKFFWFPLRRSHCVGRNRKNSSVIQTEWPSFRCRVCRASTAWKKRCLFILPLTGPSRGVKMEIGDGPLETPGWQSKHLQKIPTDDQLGFSIFVECGVLNFYGGERWHNTYIIKLLFELK